MPSYQAGIPLSSQVDCAWIYASASWNLSEEYMTCRTHNILMKWAVPSQKSEIQPEKPLYLGHKRLVYAGMVISLFRAIDHRIHRYFSSISYFCRYGK